MLGLNPLLPVDFDIPTIPATPAGEEQALVALWQAQCAWSEKVGIVPATPEKKEPEE